MLNFNGNIGELVSITPAEMTMTGYTTTVCWRVAHVINDVIIYDAIAAWAHVRLNINNRDIVVPLVAGNGHLTFIEGRSIILPPGASITDVQYETLMAPEPEGTFSLELS